MAQVAIVAYAWARGIMVLFELDVPGHAAAWAAGNPALVVSCDGGQTLINPVPAGTVPGAPSPGADLYAVLEVCPPGVDSHPVRLTLAAPAMCQALAVEYAGRAGSGALPWFHLGGDEVANYVCWDADGPGEEVSPRCTAPRCVALRASVCHRCSTGLGCIAGLLDGCQCLCVRPHRNGTSPADHSLLARPPLRVLGGGAALRRRAPGHCGAVVHRCVTTPQGAVMRGGSFLLLGETLQAMPLRRLRRSAIR